MKMKRRAFYDLVLAVLLILCTFSLVKRYPRFQFEMSHMHSDHYTAYAGQGETCEVYGYYVHPQADYAGGAVVRFTGQTPAYAIVATAQSAITHQLTLQKQGVCFMDVQDCPAGTSPQTIALYDQQNRLIEQLDFVTQDIPSYHAYNTGYSYEGVVMTETGIFMGNFDAFQKEELNDYETVTVEFCYQDDAKSSGYALLARSVLPVSQFINAEVLPFTPYLDQATVDYKQSLDVIITFSGETRKTLMMELEKGA